MIDEKQKLLKMKAEIGAAEQNITNALHHLRDYQKMDFNKSLIARLNEIFELISHNENSKACTEINKMIKALGGK